MTRKQLVGRTTYALAVVFVLLYTIHWEGKYRTHGAVLEHVFGLDFASSDVRLSRLPTDSLRIVVYGNTKAWLDPKTGNLGPAHPSEFPGTPGSMLGFEPVVCGEAGVGTEVLGISIPLLGFHGPSLFGGGNFGFHIAWLSTGVFRVVQRVGRKRHVLLSRPVINSLQVPSSSEIVSIDPMGKYIACSDHQKLRGRHGPVLVYLWLFPLPPDYHPQPCP